MKHKSTFTWLLLLTVTMLSISINSARASGQQVIKVPLSGEDGASAKAVVLSNRGPDIFVLKARNLEPHTRFTVFLTENQTPAFLPAQFIGEFETNRHGNGKLFLRTEIINAFASANQSLADDQGIADVPGAGGLGNGANTIPLNWIRVYFAEGGMNVFGRSEAEFGGGIALTSEKPLP